MKHSEFRVGMEFYAGDDDEASRWRCTDIGQRTIVAIRTSQIVVNRVRYGGRDQNGLKLEKDRYHYNYFEAENHGLIGPSFDGIQEEVFSEYDITDCIPYHVWMTGKPE